MLGASLTLILSVVTLFDDLHRMLELLSHFKTQYLLASLVFLILSISLRSITLCLAMVVSITINGYLIAPYFFQDNQPVKSKNVFTLKLLHSNVYTANTHHDALIALIQHEAPDIFVVQEVNETWLNQLDILTDIYPHQVKVPRSDNFGIALFSKWPFVSKQIAYWGNTNVPSIESTFNVNGHLFHLLATHPLPPINNEYFNARNNQLYAVARRAAEITAPKIVVGDLNITMWSSNYKTLTQQTGLRNSRFGFGTVPTWPTHFKPLMIPIDHILVSAHFTVKQLRAGGNIGSDHLPLIAELELKQPSE
jgi:Uncharacterized protein conserved in bacteria